MATSKSASFHGYSRTALIQHILYRLERYDNTVRQLYVHACNADSDHMCSACLGTTVWNGHQAQLTSEDDR